VEAEDEDHRPLVEVVDQGVEEQMQQVSGEEVPVISVQESL